MPSTEDDFYKALQAGGDPGSMLFDLIRRNRPDWFDEAACRGMDSDVFFSGRGEVDKMREAKATCARCPVREPCLEHALYNGEREGLWGGVAPRPRVKLREARGISGSRALVARPRREPMVGQPSPTDRVRAAALVRSLLTAGMSYSQLARSVGVDTSTVSRWAHGHTRPGPDAADRIAAWAEGRGWESVA